MDVVFTSLEALIMKATQECLPAPDPAALDAFCAVMRDSPEGPALAARALAARVQTGSARESLLALTALDRCMRRCDASFHVEVGKFRFLNEMIKLVSPKYYADRTALDVQQRVLQLLHAWSIEHPRESKFKVAFDMLRSQGVVKETPPPLPPEHGSPPPPPRPRAATFEDDEKSKLLQKLLRSKNPDDLQYANKLIKTMVREEERRTEAEGRRALEVRQGVESARLLRSLLEAAGDAGDDERQLMRELEQACRRHHAALQHLAAAAHRDPPALEEILQASDELTEVFAKYEIVTAQWKLAELFRLHEAHATHGAISLVDLAGIKPERCAPGARDRSGDLDTLTDIFSTENGPTSSMEPLKPVSLMSSDAEVCGGGGEERRGGGGAGLAVLDSLGAELLQKSLPGTRVGDGFAGKSTKKIPMNAIEKLSPPSDASLTGAHTLDLDFLVNKSKEAARSHPAPWPSRAAAPAPAPAFTLDDLMLDISMEPLPNCDAPRPSTTNTDQPSTGNITPQLSTSNVTPQLSTANVTSQLSTANVTTQVSMSNTTSQPASPQPQYGTNLDLILSVNKQPPVPNTNEMSPKESPQNAESAGNEIDSVEKSHETPTNNKVEVRGLSEVEVSLAGVQASAVPPLTLLEEQEGLTVVLHLATNRPRPDVNVLVLSTTSRHTSPISDYNFHAVVPKCCKVRLLPASGTCLPPHSPFLQPAAIIQLMLIARPLPHLPVSLKFVLTYCCNDDTVTEVGKVPVLPLDQL